MQQKEEQSFEADNKISENGTPILFCDCDKKAEPKKTEEHKEKLNKKKIGKPKGFQHVSHVGFEPGKGFKYEKTEDPWVKGFLNKASGNTGKVQDQVIVHNLIQHPGRMDILKNDSQLPPIPTDITSKAEESSVPEKVAPPKRKKNTRIKSNQIATPKKDYVAEFKLTGKKEAEWLQKGLQKEREQTSQGQDQRTRKMQDEEQEIRKLYDTINDSFVDSSFATESRSNKLSPKVSRKVENDDHYQLKKEDIGQPKNFRHVSHIGFDSNVGFYCVNISDKQLKHFFEKVSITENRYQDRITRELINDFTEQNNGLIKEREQRSHKPVPAPRTRLGAHSDSPPLNTRSEATCDRQYERKSIKIPNFNGHHFTLDATLKNEMQSSPVPAPRTKLRPAPRTKLRPAPPAPVSNAL